MKKIKLFIFVLLTWLQFDLIAQPNIDNTKAHRRYWYYRTRFINDFVNIGGSQGDCICFPERNFGTSNASNGSTEAKVGPDQIDIMNQYLSALALEYKLLSRSNQSTQETVKEIFYIIDTYNRLDIEADDFWSTNPPTADHNVSNSTTNLNGFILREDMPHDYFDTTTTSPAYKAISKANYRHFNFAQCEYNYTATSSLYQSYTGLEEIDKLSNDNPFSNYVGFSAGNEQQKGLSIPHDKYYTMFVAFMLLVKYLPDNFGYVDEAGATHYFKDGTFDFKNEIRQITNRCHTYLRGNTFGNNTTNWQLEYPDGTNLSGLGQPLPYSYPLSKMICYINGGYPWGWPCNGYQDALTLSTGFYLYKQLYINPIPSTFPVIGSEDAAVFLGNVMAGGNAPVPMPVFPYLPIPAAIAMDLNTSINSVEWADLMRRVLHQSGVLMKQKSVYANPINDAPCEGPYFYASSGGPNFEWRSQDRLEHPKHRLANHPAPPGNFPGVDYMLLHNLYYEYLNQLKDAGQTQTAAYTNAYNLMDNYDNRSWPYRYYMPPLGPGSGNDLLQGLDTSFFNVGYVNYPFPSSPPKLVHYWGIPADIKLYQNLDSRAHIYASASPSAPNNTIRSRVNYRAGKEINLLPAANGDGDFEVQAGAEFEAYIKRYVCSNGDYSNGIGRQAANEASNDYENDVMNTQTRIHYVQAPLTPDVLYGPPNEPESETYTAIDDKLQDLQASELATQLSEYGNTETSTELNQRFIVTPNPNEGIFTVFINKIAADENFTLTIIDAQGMVLKQWSYTSQNVKETIDISDKARGIYLLKVNSNKGFSGLKKITVR
jgi:hypothetical protein